jgi:predicted RNA-binding protein YlxR (DUF448 family)
MPVLAKEVHKKLSKELYSRMNELSDLFGARYLKTPNEGVKGRGSWVHPETMCATQLLLSCVWP